MYTHAHIYINISIFDICIYFQEGKARDKTKDEKTKGKKTKRKKHIYTYRYM